MIKKYFGILILITVLSACTDAEKKEPVTDVEVARAFIRNILDNDLKEAEQYLLIDETNRQIYDRFKQNYSSMDKDLLEKYRTSDIIVNNINNNIDSVCIFNYSTSFKRNDSTILKLVRVDNKWKIDMKYTFPGDF